MTSATNSMLLIKILQDSIPTLVFSYSSKQHLFEFFDHFIAIFKSICIWVMNFISDKTVLVSLVTLLCRLEFGCLLALYCTDDNKYCLTLSLK